MSVTDIFTIAPYSPEVVWIVVLGYIIAFVMAFGLGANDVANAFGTSVGSKVLTVRNACIVATVAEISGAVLLGAKVSDTMRKGILDITTYEGAERELMLGCLSSLVGASIWMLMATALKLPVSATHSTVGATVGFSLVARGSEGIQWSKVGQIAASWVISPVLSGVISTLIYLAINKGILTADHPMARGLIALPFIYGLTILINLFSVVYEGPPLLHFDELSWWVALLISVGCGIIVGVLVHFFLGPYLKKKCIADKEKAAALEMEGKKGVVNVGYVTSEVSSNNNGGDTATGGLELSAARLSDVAHDAAPPMAPSQTNGSAVVEQHKLEEGELPAKPTGIHAAREDDPPEIVSLFTFLQIMTATFTSFVHGGNDVSNAIGPLTAIWLIYKEGNVVQKAATPLYILGFGGLGISVGLWVWGRRVMKTIGTDLSKIVPSTGFVIEIGAAITVLIASNVGLPISTTHCLVGSVVIVGRVASSSEGVNWKLFRNIIFAWVVTLPMAGGISALVMLLLRAVAL